MPQTANATSKCFAFLGVRLHSHKSEKGLWIPCLKQRTPPLNASHFSVFVYSSPELHERHLDSASLLLGRGQLAYTRSQMPPGM